MKKNKYMQGTVQLKKQELLKWISEIEDETILDKVLTFTKPYKKDKSDTPFIDFDEAWETGITGEELKKRVYKHIESLPWKK